MELSVFETLATLKAQDYKEVAVFNGSFDRTLEASLIGKTPEESFAKAREFIEQGDRLRALYCCSVGLSRDRKSLLTRAEYYAIRADICLLGDIPDYYSRAICLSEALSQISKLKLPISDEAKTELAKAFSRSGFKDLAMLVYTSPSRYVRMYERGL